MELEKRQRHIASNIFYWLAVAACGLVLLTVVRQYGWGLTARHTARKLLAEGALYDQQNAELDCQRALDKALQLDPSVCARVIERFGPRIIGLPAVRARLKEIADGPLEQVDEETLARLALLLGDLTEAVRLLDPMVESDRASDDTGLLLGRLALEAGDVFLAKKHFDAYWEAPGRNRAAVETAILGPGVRRPEILGKAGHRLLWAGLWHEAFSAFDAARKAGPDGPELRFYEGVELEINGKRQAAVDAYYDVLAEIPTHLLALKRLEVLLSS